MWGKFGLAACLALVACGETGGGDTIVPIKQLLAETAGRPYECVNYDRVTDSCRSQALLDVNGDTIRFDIRTVQHYLPAGIADGGELRLRMTSRIDGNVFCTNLRAAEVSVTGVSSGDASRIAAFYRKSLRDLGQTCTTYLRHGGHYRFVNVTPSGFVVTEGIDRARFFATPRNLRQRLP